MTPEQATLIEAGAEDALLDVHTMRPAIVDKVYKTGSKTTHVDLRIGKRMVENGRGVVVPEALPILIKRPVWRFCSGGFIVYMPVNKGDLGYIVCMEDSIGQFLEGGAAEEPDHVKRFDLSNTVFIPGFKRNADESGFTPQKDGLVIGYEGGVYVAIESNGTITAENSAGSFELAPTGRFSANGTNFTVDP
jgi:hypothetical protein